MTYSNFKKIIPTFFAGLILSFSNVNAETLDTIVAIVDDDVIMASELERRVDRVQSEAAQKGMQLPHRSDLEKQVLERLIMTKVQLEVANRIGVKVDDNMLNRAVSNIASENNVSLEEFRQTLENEGFNFSQFREEIREEIILSRVRQRQVDNKIFVSDREVNNYLATQSQQGNDVEELRLQHILISIPEDADEDQKNVLAKKAEETMEKLKSGEDFSTIAAEVSDSGNATGGGDMGWMEPSNIPSLFSAKISEMKKGDISELIKNESGYHIVKLADKRSTDIQMIDQTRARHILIRTNALTSDQGAENRLKQLKERIESGADFSELARSHSEDNASAVRGGELGWVSPGIMVPVFEKEMDKLSDGEISEPFQSQFGWHIIQVMEHRQYDGTEELTIARARAAVKKRKIEDERQSWLIRLRDEAYVEYRL